MSGHIDWFAVEVVCNGSQLALNPAERRAVVRRLHHKMRPQYVTKWDAKWSLTTEEVAERMYVTPRSVQRMKDELPEADKTCCPVCGQDMWVWRNSVVEPHPDGLNQECPLSGEVLEDQDWESRTALTIVWLAQRLRSGDSVGVWNHISRLSETEGHQLLVAALAAVPEVDDPFSWLNEWAEVA